MTTVIVGVAFIVVLAVVVIAREKVDRLRKHLEEQKKDTDQRMYELAILKELGDRVGYSLDVQQIVDVITGSLHQFIEYGAVSYMLLEPEKVLFKIHLEQSVHRGFIDEVRKRMLGSLSALLNKDLSESPVEEVLSGAILIEDMQEPVRSFFNIPIVIGENVVGVLTVADTKPGLYKEEEMTILYKITNQASQAVTKLQEVVATEQSKLNAMVESMSDGVVMTDTSYRIMVANPAAKSIIGKQEADAVTIFDFIDNLGGTFDMRGRLEESVKLGKEFVEDRVFIQDKFYQVFVLPVLNTTAVTNEEVLGGVVVFHDVTHEIEIERLRDEFTSMLVHELRGPLGGIRHIVEVLHAGKKRRGSKSYTEYLDMVHKNATQMLGLVNDILDVAKIESGKFDLQKEESSIPAVIDEQVEFFKPSAEQSGVTLTSVHAEGSGVSLLMDTARVKQVINNLVTNALKFTRSGGSVTVASVVHAAGGDLAAELKAAGVSLPFSFEEGEKMTHGGIVVGVIDNGVGISENGVKKLFSRFTQLAPRGDVPERKGTGLGLSIAKGIVEAHGGTIHVASEEGAGSMFYFVLPLQETA